MRDGKGGVHLYVKRVFIMDDCDELCPDTCGSSRASSSAADLSLNVSREILQQDRQTRDPPAPDRQGSLDHQGLQTERPENYRHLLVRSSARPSRRV